MPSGCSTSGSTSRRSRRSTGCCLDGRVRVHGSCGELWRIRQEAHEHAAHRCQPWEWSKNFGFSQGVELESPERVLVCSGQTAVGPDGAPPSTSDMGEQVRAALENLRTVLDGAGMVLTDVVKVNAFTTDVDALFGAWGSV